MVLNLYTWKECINVILIISVNLRSIRNKKILKIFYYLKILVYRKTKCWRNKWKNKKKKKIIEEKPSDESSKKEDRSTMWHWLLGIWKIGSHFIRSMYKNFLWMSSPSNSISGPIFILSILCLLETILYWIRNNQIYINFEN